MVHDDSPSIYNQGCKMECCHARACHVLRHCDTVLTYCRTVSLTVGLLCTYLRSENNGYTFYAKATLHICNYPVLCL